MAENSKPILSLPFHRFLILPVSQTCMALLAVKHYTYKQLKFQLLSCIVAPILQRQSSLSTHPIVFDSTNADEFEIELFDPYIVSP